MPNAVSIDRQRQQRDRRPRSERRGGNFDAPKEEKIFNEYVVSVDRVARVVKGGRRFRFKALVAVGDSKSRVGIGVAKGMDVQVAVSKATDKAKKSLVTIPVVNNTIPHDVEAKVGGAKVLLRSAAPGTGVIAGGTVRNIVALTGISNLIAKALGSNNKVNNAYATLEALRKLVPRDQWIKKAKSLELKAESKKPKSTGPSDTKKTASSSKATGTKKEVK
jgi:small subunit ribosomal protein S5